MIRRAVAILVLLLLAGCPQPTPVVDYTAQVRIACAYLGDAEEAAFTAAVRDFKGQGMTRGEWDLRIDATLIGDARECAFAIVNLVYGD